MMITLQMLPRSLQVLFVLDVEYQTMLVRTLTMTEVAGISKAVQQAHFAHAARGVLVLPVGFLAALHVQSPQPTTAIVQDKHLNVLQMVYPV